MILEPGAKLLVAHRRLFDQDHTRFFTGVVEGYEQGIVRVYGHTWLRDGYLGTFERKSDERTKIISIASGTMIVYLLPSSTDMESLALDSDSTSIILRDDRGFAMDVSETSLHPAASTPDARQSA